ncbi:aryl-sulfate sulfotransferase [Kaarinaea lacus]
MRFLFRKFKTRPATLLKRLTHLILYASILGCVNAGIANTSPPQFVSPPEIEMDPNLSTPLAGLLRFSTNLPSKVLLDISTGSKSWTIKFDEFKTDHSYTVLGFRPDKTHAIKVHIINRNGQRTTFKQPLTVITDPLPDGFPTFVTIKSQPHLMEPGYTLLDVIPEGENSEFGALIVIVDENGDVVWYQVGTRYTNVRQTDDGNLMFLQGALFVEMDMLGNTVREWKAMGKSSNEINEIAVATRSFHHEAFPMDNGNFLVLSIEVRRFDNYPTSAWKPGSPTESIMVAGDLIIEFRPDGTIVNEWSLLELLDPYRVSYDSLGKYWDSFFGTKTRDWAHANSVIHSPIDDSIIVSIRHQDAVVKFSRKTGELIWILGTHDNWDNSKFGKYLLHPVNDQKFFFPYHQHSPMILPNGNILLYDNGNYRASPFRKIVPVANNFSRAVEYSIDEENMTAELVWEYGQFTENTIFSGALGDANYLPKTGNVLITHGNIYEKKSGKKLSAQIVEVTHTTPPTEVFNMVIFDDTPDPENGWRVYRSERISSLYPE